MYRPHVGANTPAKRLSQIEASYTEVTSAEARPLWDAQAEASLRHCMHGTGCKRGGYPQCKVGARIREVGLLTGCILRVWSLLGSAMKHRKLAAPPMEESRTLIFTLILALILP